MGKGITWYNIKRAKLNLSISQTKPTTPDSLNQTYQTKLMSVQMVVRRLDEHEAEIDQGSVGVQKFSENAWLELTKILQF